MIELLVVLAFSAVWVGMNLWAGLAERDYARLYATRHGEPNPLVDSQELKARYFLRPWRWFLEAPGITRQMLRATSERQSDPQLETARLGYLWRRRITLGVGSLGLVLLIIFLFGRSV